LRITIRVNILKKGIRRTLLIVLGSIITASGVCLFFLGGILTQDMIGFITGAATGTLIAIWGILIIGQVLENHNDDHYDSNLR